MTAPTQDVPSGLPHPLTLLPIAIGADLLGRLVSRGRGRTVSAYIGPLVAGAAVAATTAQLTQGRGGARGARAQAAAADDRALRAAAVAMLTTAAAAWPRPARARPAGLAVVALGAIGFASFFALTSRGGRRRRTAVLPPRVPPGAHGQLHRPEVAAAVRTAAGDSLRGL